MNYPPKYQPPPKPAPPPIKISYGTSKAITGAQIQALTKATWEDQTEINFLYGLKSQIQNITVFGSDLEQVRRFNQSKQNALSLIDQLVQKERDEMSGKNAVISFLRQVEGLPGP